MSQIPSLIAANTLPQLAIPLIESSSLPSGTNASRPGQHQSPRLLPQDSVTISSESAALQTKV